MKPILFNTEMVKRILSGDKTQTRRIINPQPKGNWVGWTSEKGKDIAVWETIENADKINPLFKTSPCYQLGDVLYVRETIYRSPSHGGWRYLDEIPEECFITRNWMKVPSICMPKEAARIFLKVAGIRAERLQRISYGDCCEEGVLEREKLINCHFGSLATERFKTLWDSTIKKKELNKYGWEANPWVWVVEFEKIDNPELMEEFIF